MPTPSWPAVPYQPMRDSYRIVPRLSPIATEMEGGNVRLRRRPGDNVSIITQVVRMTNAEFDTLAAWVSASLSGGVARFTMSVMIGTSFTTKTVQFEAGNQFPYGVSEPALGLKDVSMTLRVYGV